MILKNKNILIISPQSWNHIFVSKHHYAVYLSKRGNKVFFLNPPTNKFSISVTNYDNLWVLDYTPFVKGLRFLPVFLQKNIIQSKFNHLQKIIGENLNIVWSFDDSVFYDLSIFPKNVIKIYHNVDLNQNFHFKKAAGTADICLGVCRPIVNRLKVYNKNSHFINHGFNNCNILPSLHGLSDESELKAFYAGNLDSKYLDWDTLFEVIKTNEDVKFYFAGKWDNEGIRSKMLAQRNIEYLGILSASQLSGFYQESDVLLVCYKYDEEPEQLSNSHKFMEYLGSGKMVVASQTAEYLVLSGKGLLLMAKENKEFPDLFRKAICNLGYWNSTEKKKARQTYALQNTYEKQIERIEAIISTMNETPAS